MDRKKGNLLASLAGQGLARHMRLMAFGLGFICLVYVLGACSSWLPASSDEPPGMPESRNEFPKEYRSEGSEWKKLVAFARGEGRLSSLPGPPEPSRLYYTQIYGLIEPGFGVGTILIKEENLSLRPWGSEEATHESVTALSVMRRSKDPLYQETGGWSFEAYDPKTFLRLEDESTQCLNCHRTYSHQDWRAVVGHEQEPAQ